MKINEKDREESFTFKVRTSSLSFVFEQINLLQNLQPYPQRFYRLRIRRQAG